MKKSAIFIIITTRIILLPSCSTKEQNKETNLQMNMDNMAVVSVDDEFDEIIANNPIDKDFLYRWKLPE